MRKDEVRSHLERVVTPVLENMGLELVNLELKREAGRLVLRVFVDSEEGIDLDSIAVASQAISSALDREDPIKQRYTLEVSSPGIDRLLTKPAHFERFMGSKVAVRLFEPLNGRRNYTGALVAADDNGFAIDADGERMDFDYADVLEVRLKPEIKF